MHIIEDAPVQKDNQFRVAAKGYNSMQQVVFEQNAPVKVELNNSKSDSKQSMLSLELPGEDGAGRPKSGRLSDYSQGHNH